MVLPRLRWLRLLAARDTPIAAKEKKTWRPQHFFRLPFCNCRRRRKVRGHLRPYQRRSLGVCLASLVLAGLRGGLASFRLVEVWRHSVCAALPGRWQLKKGAGICTLRCHRRSPPAIEVHIGGTCSLFERGSPGLGQCACDEGKFGQKTRNQHLLRAQIART